MKNVVMRVDGNKLMIEVDLSKNFGRSKSGKTIIIGSTEGNQKIETADGDVVLGLNCYKKP